MLDRANREPSPHRVPDEMGAVIAEIIDHGDDVAGSLLLNVELGIGRFVAESTHATRNPSAKASTIPLCVQLSASMSSPCCKMTRDPEPSTV